MFSAPCAPIKAPEHPSRRLVRWLRASVSRTEGPEIIAQKMFQAAEMLQLDMERLLDGGCEESVLLAELWEHVTEEGVERLLE